MLDLHAIRANPNLLQNLIDSGRADPKKVDMARWLELDTKRSELISKVEKLRSERNAINSNITSKPSPDVVQHMNKLKAQIQAIEVDLDSIEKQWKEILDWIPNLPFLEVPQGSSSEENIEIKSWDPKQGYFLQDKLGKGEHSGQYFSKYGAHADKEFEPIPHWELGTRLGLIDIEAGAKVSGSRFYYITGYGALLVYGCFNLLFQKLIKDGFSPMIVPLLVRDKALYGSSHFPGDADQVYKLEAEYLEDSNSLYLIGSSEPSNFAYFADKILDLSSPIKVMAQTPCFRSEVGSWGRDVRGIKRTHQFDKIEMNVIMEADDDKAREMQEYLLSINEWLLQTLQIPYHVINMCIGDLGYYAASKKYDVEFWTPTMGGFTELMSNSITTDYQSRRLNIRYKDANGNLKYAYTLNDTGITHRILIALLDHYQQSDGTLKVPEALVDYVGKEFIG
jgi:seryl-tRNA synthetase